MIESLFITGMHRCGTSWTSSAFHSLGAHMGQISALYEDVRVVNYHDKLIEWWNPKQPIIDSEITGNILKLVEKKEHECNEAKKTVWGWKDPRGCFLLPYWLPFMSKNGRIVICFRNPYEVAKSLLKRNGNDEETWLKLYAVYGENLLAIIDRYSDIYDGFIERVHYVWFHLSDDVMKKNNETIKKACVALGLKPIPLGVFLKHEMKHHNSSEKDVKIGEALYIYNVYQERFYNQYVNICRTK